MPSRRRFADPQDLSDPYRELAVVGLTPDSSLAAVLDASFDLMDLGMTPAIDRAWSDLRLTERRLLVDFFHYDLQEGEASGAAAGAPLPPLPLGWLESLAYPLPAGPAFASQVPAEPPPFLDQVPAPWPEEGEDHE